MPAGRCPGRQDLGQRTVGNQPEGRNSEIICVEFPGKHWGHIHTTFAPDPPLSTNQGAKMSTAKHNKNTNRNKRLAPEFWPDGHLCEGGGGHTVRVVPEARWLDGKGPRAHQLPLLPHDGFTSSVPKRSPVVGRLSGVGPAMPATTVGELVLQLKKCLSNRPRKPHTLNSAFRDLNAPFVWPAVCIISIDNVAIAKPKPSGPGRTPPPPSRGPGTVAPPAEPAGWGSPGQSTTRGPYPQRWRRGGGRAAVARGGFGWDACFDLM